MKKRFLLCIGCQKGGTTWLSEHLRRMPDVRLGVRKEMHVLDAHFLDDYRNAHLAKIRRREAQLVKFGTPAKKEAHIVKKLELQIQEYREAQALIADLVNYASYYRQKADEDGVKVVADFTPTYALLEAQHWATAKKILEDSDFDLRILFLMRDPVERIESAWRMLTRNTTRVAARGRGRLADVALRAFAYGRHLAAKSLPTQPDGKFLRFALDEGRLNRSRFDRTIQAVEAVFPSSQVHYEFYETLFNDDAISKITEFIGIPPRLGEFERRINSSPLSTPISPQDLLRVRETLDPTYNYCAERFGKAEIKAIWNYY